MSIQNYLYLFYASVVLLNCYKKFSVVITNSSNKIKIEY